MWINKAIPLRIASELISETPHPGVRSYASYVLLDYEVKWPRFTQEEINRFLELSRTSPEEFIESQERFGPYRPPAVCVDSE